MHMLPKPFWKSWKGRFPCISSSRRYELLTWTSFLQINSRAYLASRPTALIWSEPALLEGERATVANMCKLYSIDRISLVNTCQCAAAPSMTRPISRQITIHASAHLCVTTPLCRRVFVHVRIGVHTHPGWSIIPMCHAWAYAFAFTHGHVHTNTDRSMAYRPGEDAVSVKRQVLEGTGLKSCSRCLRFR